MIHWNIDPEIIALGPFSVRWYGVLFAAAFFLGYRIFEYFYKIEKRNPEELNDLLWYTIVGTVVGARLGHCLFYEPQYYLANPLEILMVWKGGLASHGAAIGILTALYFYVKKVKDIKFLWLIDRVSIVTALGGAFIRVGNLFNSEIYGSETNVAWSFIFERVDNIPRHPSQIYEALAYFSIFLVLIYFYKKFKDKVNNGFFLGIFLITVFGFRIFVEFFKADQTDFEAGMILNMGQILSIPAVLAGIVLLFLTQIKDKKNDN